jgi:putative transposase
MAARLKHFDYSSSGDYFITIITKYRAQCFGQIIPSIENSEERESIMMLNAIGLRAHECLLELNHHFSNAIIDEFIVMPDHVHFILSIKKPNATDATTQKEFKSNRFSRPVAGSVSVIVQQFKAEVKRWCGKNGFEAFQWQPRFYDRLIRDYQEFANVKKYIQANPKNWGKK